MKAGDRFAYSGAAWHAGVPYFHDGLVELSERHDEGWLAITAAGAEVLLPHSDLRASRLGRRVCARCLRWHAGTGGECAQCAGLAPSP